MNEKHLKVNVIVAILVSGLILAGQNQACQSTNQPTNRPTNQATNQLTSGRPANQPTDQPSNQPINQRQTNPIPNANKR